jgi:hypothetical protein
MRRLFVVALLAALAHSVHAAAPPVLPDWVTAARFTPVPEWAAKSKAVVLLDDTSVMVDASGGLSTHHRRVLKILSAGGSDYGYAAVDFDNDTQVRLLQGWAIDAQSQTYAQGPRDVIETTPSYGELYSDARMKVLHLPAAAGGIVAYEYVQNRHLEVLQDAWRFQSDIPVLVARFAATYPQGWSHEVHWSNHEPVAPLTTGSTSWELHDLHAVDDEPRMPAAAALGGRLAINFIPPPPSGHAHASWSDVASWFASLAAPRNALTPAIEAKVHELAPNGASIDAIRALARFVQRDVRYVAVEIGIGGYQPHAAGDVFTTRNGDCKDKATLLRAMLGKLGVDAYYVVVNTTRGVVEPEFPTIGAFNHVVLAIKVPADAKYPGIIDAKAGRLLIFDPTSTSTAFGMIPWYLQDNQGLLVTPDGGGLVTLPAHAPETNQLRRTAKLTLDGSGTLAGAIDEVRTGRIAAELRDHLQGLSVSDRTRYFESVLSTHLAQSTIADLAIDNLDDVESDLHVHYTLKAPNYAMRAADLLLVRPRVIGQKADLIVDTRERKHGYATDGPSVQTDDVTIALPPGVTVDELPPAVSMTTPAIEYASKSEVADGALHYTRRYALRAFVVQRDAIPDLNKAFAQILSDERASAVLK